MQLDVGGRISVETVNQLKEDLRPVLEISSTRPMSYRSPDAPSFIQLLGQAIEWLDPLKVASTVFLSQLAKEAASDLWENKKRIAVFLKDAAVKPLQVVAASIAKVLTKSGQQRTNFSIGLSLPEDYFGTAVNLENEHEDEIAWIVSNFVVRADKIETAIREEMAGQNKPLGRVQLTIQPNGSFLLQWVDDDEMRIHERTIE